MSVSTPVCVGVCSSVIPYNYFGKCLGKVDILNDGRAGSPSVKCVFEYDNDQVISKLNFCIYLEDTCS